MSEGQAESPRARRRPARRATRSTPPVVMLLDAGMEIDAPEVEFQGTPLAAAVRACCTADDFKHAARARRMVEFLVRR